MIRDRDKREQITAAKSSKKTRAASQGEKTSINSRFEGDAQGGKILF